MVTVRSSSIIEDVMAKVVEHDAVWGACDWWFERNEKMLTKGLLVSEVCPKVKFS